MSQKQIKYHKRVVRKSMEEQAYSILDGYVKKLLQMPLRKRIKFGLKLIFKK